MQKKAHMISRADAKRIDPELFDELAGIYEYQANIIRPEAERLAALDVFRIKERQRQNASKTDHTVR